MLLAIDTGNTQTVIGLFDGTELADHWRIATAAERTSDELALMIQQFLGFHGFSFDDQITGVVVCSGVPRITASLRDMTQRYFGFDALVVEPGVRTGMPILYDNPKEVGPDRIADAVAAYEKYGGPTVVVDFPSPSGVGVIAVTTTYFPRRPSPSSRSMPSIESFALPRPYGSTSSSRMSEKRGSRTRSEVARDATAHGVGRLLHGDVHAAPGLISVRVVARLD